jgi:C-terminal processing protease CtpA/Prc
MHRRTYTALLLSVILTALASPQPGIAQDQLSFQRLANAAKLWAYIKYVHPRVTASPVDWDKAFAQSAPRVLQAQTETDYAAAVGDMLATLRDPATRILEMGEPSDPTAADPRIVLTVKNPTPGVAVVSLEPGTPTQADQAGDSLVRKLTGVPAVVFDLRGSKAAGARLPVLPVSKVGVGPSVTMRLHAGYFNVFNPFESGYNSSWVTRQIAELRPAINPLRAVFLVNGESLIPAIALAMQDSGVGAIVSEGLITDTQVGLTTVVPLPGNLRARIRIKDLVHADGTTGLSANVVLAKTGDEALNAAIDIARSGDWPAPSGRPTLTALPAFFFEEPYSSDPYPDTNYRMLAAARIWGVFNYFHSKHLYGEDWDAVLTEFLPKVAAARNAREYDISIAEMVAHVHDSHSFYFTRELSDYRDGNTALSVETRWIENQPVVTRLFDATLTGSVAPGDIVTRINGEPVQKRIDDLSRQIPASTPQALMRDVTATLLSVNGPDGTLAAVTVKTASGGEREFQIRHSTNARATFAFPPLRPGAVFRLITPKIGYVDLDRLTSDQVDAMFETFKGTDAMILDMRGYPRGGTWAISSSLPTRSFAPTGVSNLGYAPGGIPLVTGDALVFGSFRQLATSPEGIRPPSAGNRHVGKTVMLIDERTQSAAETAGGIFRTEKGTVLIGSPTAGADGYVTRFVIPGGAVIPFSGTVWGLQRIGLKPDIEVRPTVAGIRAGRDEILERAVAYIEQGR